MDRTEAERRLERARTGHLATDNRQGIPHVVVVTFATLDGHIVTAIDNKPKTTTRLKRLTNIESNPNASFLVDHYSEDWNKLWWVRVDGSASIHRDGELFDNAITALVFRYPQYQVTPPYGPVIAVKMAKVTGWQSSP